jgi:Protein of unknown function (DUF732)
MSSNEGSAQTLRDEPTASATKANSANPPRRQRPNTVHQFPAWARLVAGVVLVILVIAGVFFPGFFTGRYHGDLFRGAVGFLVPGANPVEERHPVQDFLAAVQAAGISGAQPAMLENGYNVCWEIWNGGYTGEGAAAALQKNYPTLTTDQAAHFVIAAYENLCPVPGAYDWWAYSTS